MCMCGLCVLQVRFGAARAPYVFDIFPAMEQVHEQLTLAGMPANQLCVGAAPLCAVM